MKIYFASACSTRWWQQGGCQPLFPVQNPGWKITVFGTHCSHGRGKKTRELLADTEHAPYRFRSEAVTYHISHTVTFIGQSPPVANHQINWAETHTLPTEGTARHIAIGREWLSSHVGGRMNCFRIIQYLNNNNNKLNNPTHFISIQYGEFLST